MLDKQPIPPNSSRTIVFSREEKFSVPTSPTQLTEGVTPDAVGITLNQFTATAEQYGFLVVLSDLAALTVKHPIVEKTIYLEGLYAAELYDLLIYNVLTASTNVYRPNARSSNLNLVATDTLGYNDMVQTEALLFNAGARPMEDGDFVFVVAPNVYTSLLEDATFKQAAQFRAPERIWKGEVMELAGHRIVRSNAPAFSAISQSQSGSANKVYNSFAIGRFAYQISDLQNMQAYVVAPGGQADPLKQRYKIGLKFDFKSIVTNPSWIINIFSAGSDSVNN